MVASPRFTGTLLAVLLAAFAVATPIRANTLTVFAEAPVDLKRGDLDLRALELNNRDPLYVKRYQIPYAAIEPMIRRMIAQKADRTLNKHFKCTAAGVDSLCPDADVRGRIVSSFRFLDHAQPQIRMTGKPSDNRVVVELNTQAEVGVDVRIQGRAAGVGARVHSDIYAIIGVHATVEIATFPVLKAISAKVELTHDGGNFDLAAPIAQIGAVGGMASTTILLGDPVLGSLIGGLFAKATEPYVKRYLKDQVNAAIANGLQQANARIESEIAKQLADPRLSRGIDIERMILDRRVPVLGMTVGQVFALGHLHVDVRSSAERGNLTTVVVTRFTAPNGNAEIGGVIRFPKTHCETGKTRGSGLPTAIAPFNDDLKNGASCAALIGEGNVLTAVYLGENPDEFLHTRQRGNIMDRWRAGTPLRGVGRIRETGDYFECGYRIRALPVSGIIDLGVAEGSSVANRLDRHAFRARYLVSSVAGRALLFNETGRPVNPNQLNFGGAGPASLGECPMDNGFGMAQRPNRDPAQRLNPAQCPMCGALRVWNGDEQTRPADPARWGVEPVRDGLMQKGVGIR